jgi:hypothetical protein
MKKLAALMIGMALTLSCVSVSFGATEEKKEGKKKGGKKKGEKKEAPAK